MLKLSRGLVVTGWQTHPNCNLILNCAGSSRRLLRQKLQDVKCISFSESVKRPMCNIRQNRWCITRGTQPERLVLPLESRSYNKAYPRPKVTASRRLMIQSLSSLFKYRLDFPKQCLHIAHSHPSVLLDSYLPMSHIVVESQVPPYSQFTLIVLLYWPILSRILLCVDSLQALSFWSHATSCNHPVLLSKRRSPPIALMVASV
jgi:hypothetical protein